MVVCKFFQQGYCRYGQNCRFEHVYASKYSYHASNATQQVPQSSFNAGNFGQEAPQPNPGVTDELIVSQVTSEVEAALKGGQWLLSSYKPFKEKPSFPGLIDLSPEEARLFIYEAKANNTLDQAVKYMNGLFNEARSKYEQLHKPSPHMINVIKGLYKGENVSSPFGNVPQGNSGFGSTANNASSVFRSAVQSTSPFGSSNVPSNSVFAQNNATNVFGSQPTNQAAKSIFSQANQSMFGPSNTTGNNVFGNNQNAFGSPSQQTNIFATQTGNNVFATNQAPAGSVFATNQAPTSNAFGSPKPADVFVQASQNVFGSSQSSNVFGANQATTGNTNSVFGAPQTSGNIFGVQQSNVVVDESGIYSKDEDMTPEYLEAFNSPDFKIGFIPELAPPKALC